MRNKITMVLEFLGYTAYILCDGSLEETAFTVRAFFVILIPIKLIEHFIPSFHVFAVKSARSVRCVHQSKQQIQILENGFTICIRYTSRHL